MAELKTKPTDDSVEKYLAGVEDDGRRRDCFELLELMREVTGEEPALWGGSMVGFGSYHYRYDSGHEGNSFLTGFAPRKRNLSLYLNCYLEPDDELLSRLGKVKSGKACIYLSKLEDIDLEVLRALVKRSVADLKERYG